MTKPVAPSGDNVRAHFRANLYDGHEGGVATHPINKHLTDLTEIVGYIFEEMGLIRDAYEWAGTDD